MTETASEMDVRRTRRAFPAWALGVGALVGVLGGLVGLGGAEFRLPLLLGTFGFAALAAVVVNRAMSLVVVVAAIPSRLAGVPRDAVGEQWPVVLNLLAGSLLGSWLGAAWATRMRPSTLHRVLAVLLVGIAIVFAAEHTGTSSRSGSTALPSSPSDCSPASASASWPAPSSSRCW